MPYRKHIANYKYLNYIQIHHLFGERYRVKKQYRFLLYFISLMAKTCNYRIWA
uniref:Uncharacterized protein n=1 Tax=Kuenenia stuttgartiensis TaxID=174633 RepID=Q1PWA2_KUEST|nr:unknown protein [Candidatus Kuenenia stuttgartiensis]